MATRVVESRTGQRLYAVDVQVQSHGRLVRGGIQVRNECADPCRLLEPDEAQALSEAIRDAAKELGRVFASPRRK